jgi:4-hydroxybenzoate polyprenyltransferase
VRERIDAYLQLIRFDRPVGWLLLLWPCWWGLWLAAGGTPPLGVLVIFSLGVWLTRSGGCIANDLADRWLDPQVARTQARPLATGRVSRTEALLLLAGLMLVAFGLVLLTNRLTVYLSFAALALALSYPYLKRWTYLPQVYLGAAFGMSIPMAYAAVTDSLPPLCWLAFVANVLWSTGYDTLYAMVDRDDDLKAGAKSTAILFGDLDLVAVGVLYASFLLAMGLAGQRAGLGSWYAAGWASRCSSAPGNSGSPAHASLPTRSARSAWRTTPAWRCGWGWRSTWRGRTTRSLPRYSRPFPHASRGSRPAWAATQASCRVCSLWRSLLRCSIRPVPTLACRSSSHTAGTVAIARGDPACPRALRDQPGGPWLWVQAPLNAAFIAWCVYAVEVLREGVESANSPLVTIPRLLILALFYEFVFPAAVDDVPSRMRVFRHAAAACNLVAFVALMISWLRM